MKVIELTIKREGKKPIGVTYLCKYNVKYKRKKQGEIYEFPDNKFQVHIGRLCWNKKSMQDCKDHLIECTNNFLCALCEERVEIKIVEK